MILFACVGGGLDMSTVNASMVGYSFAVILVGLTIRFIVTFLITYSKNYNAKERLFMAICWLPKATV